MTSLFDVSINIFTNVLIQQQNLLKKAEEFAAENGMQVSQLVEAKLAENMWELSMQVIAVARHIRLSINRMTGQEVDVPAFEPIPIEECHKLLANTSELVKKLTPDAFKGPETREVILKAGPYEKPVSLRDYLLDFAFPNIWFHATTTYSILRFKGLNLSKMDYLSPFAAHLLA